MSIPAANDEFVIKILASTITSLISLLVAVGVWAFKRMEKSLDDMNSMLNNHTTSDDSIHDKLFQQQRETDGKLNELIGEHKVHHK